VEAPPAIISSGSLGTMGYGLPSAIGAKVAKPGHLAIGIDGDASFNMTLTEISTTTQFDIGVKVKVIVLSSGDTVANSFL